MTTTPNYQILTPAKTQGWKLISDLNAMATSIDSALVTVNTRAASGVTAAAAAQSTANTAKTNAATAQTAAEAAQSTANTAKTNAATAQTAANNAQTTANTAVADTGWTNVATPSGFSLGTGAGTANLAYRRKAGIVYLKGYLTRSSALPSGAWVTLFTLPSGNRPIVRSRTVVGGHSNAPSSSVANLIMVNVETDGRVQVAGVGDGSDSLYLGGMSFVAN